MTLNKTYPTLLSTLSLIGLIASFVLLIDTIELIKNPNIDLPCNISPFISCTSVASRPESEIFGFPNPILGLISFGALFASGLAMMLGSKFSKKYLQLINLGLLANMAFVVWFFYQSVYDISSLCIYCMTVWIVTWPLFLYTTIWNYKENAIGENKLLKFISNKHIQTLMIVYFVATTLVVLKFKDFFLS